MASAFQNQIESWRQRTYASPAGQFMHWWLAELKGMLPESLRERMQHAQRSLIMRLQAQELELFWEEGDQLQQLDVYLLDQDVPVQRQQISDQLAKQELDEAPRKLVLPEELVLRKALVMPLATEANLRQALSFEMDRHTPFRADDVYFDYLIGQRDKDKAQLRLTLFVVTRDALDKQLEVLRARGLSPSAVDVVVEGKSAGLNLLPLEARHRVTNRRTRMNMLLAAVAFLLLAIVMGQSLGLREAQIDYVNEAIAEVTVEARRVQNIRTQIEDASEAASFMLLRRAENRPTLKVIAEVTRILPDDTYLDRLRVWDGNMQIQGKSDNAQQLIEQVNLSPLFESAGFRGSTRLDGRTQKEIFDLSARLVDTVNDADADADGAEG
jgi:general secretion pathway protein L